MKKGSGQFGPGVIVGSAEYFRLMRKKNPLPQKLAQARYMARQRQLMLAARLAKEDNISLEEAIDIVQIRIDEEFKKMDAIAAVRDVMKEEGQISGRTYDPASFKEYDPATDKSIVVTEEKNPLAVEYAEKHRISYADAFRIMMEVDNYNKWDEEMEKCDKVS